MNWPAILTPLLAPNFLVTLIVIVCATVLLALGRIDAAMWWTALRRLLARLRLLLG